MSDPNIFKPGDVVRISNIPGPRMVVSKIIVDAKGVLIRCFWFNRRNEFTGQDFAPSFLSKASPWTERTRGDDDFNFIQRELERREETADASD